MVIALGSNQTILNELFNVSLYPWFKKMHPSQMECVVEKEWLEPTKNSSLKSKTDRLATVGSTWLGFTTRLEPISSPKSDHQEGYGEDVPPHLC